MTTKRKVRIYLPTLTYLIHLETVPYKTLQLLSCRFNEGDEDKVKHHIKYRHKVSKVHLESMQLKLAQICSVIKDKNPSLVK